MQNIRGEFLFPQSKDETKSEAAAQAAWDVIELAETGLYDLYKDTEQTDEFTRYMSSYQGVRLKPLEQGDHLGLVEPLGQLFVAWRHRETPAGMRHARHDGCFGRRLPGLRRYPAFAEAGRQLSDVHDGTLSRDRLPG